MLKRIRKKVAREARLPCRKWYCFDYERSHLRHTAWLLESRYGILQAEHGQTCTLVTRVEVTVRHNERSGGFSERNRRLTRQASWRAYRVCYKHVLKREILCDASCEALAPRRKRLRGYVTTANRFSHWSGHHRNSNQDPSRLRSTPWVKRLKKVIGSIIVCQVVLRGQVHMAP
jgi:hypothetical protein